MWNYIYIYLRSQHKKNNIKNIILASWRSIYEYSTGFLCINKIIYEKQNHQNNIFIYYIYIYIFWKQNIEEQNEQLLTTK